MELVLTRQTGSQVAVTCDGQPSHAFDLPTLIPNDQHKPPHPIEDPKVYGSTIYAALFPSATLARRQLENAPERILLVSSDNELDAVPWEYAYGVYGPTDAANAEGFLVLECHVVRGLPTEQRISAPMLEYSPHIISIPSNPLTQAVEPLNIEGEWMRLREAIQDETLQEYAITLERARPPTLERVRQLVANQQNRIVHFMGHGGQDEKEGAILCFEKDNGDLDLVTAKDFMHQVRGVFLVTLNACVSATPGETHFSNLASALVRQKIPYALGMRFSIPDGDALTFSRTFYSYLARGSSVEEALFEARLTLSRSQHQWIIGVPVLYTALSSPATGFSSIKGIPVIEEHQPRIEASALPRSEGTFQGRTDHLKQLGTWLTGDTRPRIITIHGGGGQGKTTLARETIERFAYAWPGGVWATTLENLPTRDFFVNDLARFLGIAPDPAEGLSQLEKRVLLQLSQRRTLIVLDNAETLVDAVETLNTSAIHLVELLKQLPGPTVSLLVSSRMLLDWPGEVSLELDGLSTEEGAALFLQNIPQRMEVVDFTLALQLSQRVDGHPLSLRLLGGAFNASTIPLQAFLAEHEAHLIKAENKYVDMEHRQRTLYASIETSVRYLDEEHRHLLSGLWLFRSLFLPQTAAQIFDPQAEYVEAGAEIDGKDSPIYSRLHTLWRHGLSNREKVSVHEGTLLFYRLPPTMRPYIEQFLARANEREYLLSRFGAAYSHLVDFLHRELNRGSIAAAMALLLREDLDQGASCLKSTEQGYYLLRWGWILHRLGYRISGLELTERALEIGQQQDQGLALQALTNMAAEYQQTGHPHEALQLYEQALSLRREVGNRAGEAATLNNMARVYADTGQPREALKLYEQAFGLMREIGNRAGEAATLNNMALAYRQIGQPQQALRLYEQALYQMREVGNRAGEAATLNNMALAYRQIDEHQQALNLYEQAQHLTREVGDRAGEATTLNNMAEVYQQIGQSQQALRLYEQALHLMREVGDRAGEATTLNNLAAEYQQTGHPHEALQLYEVALPLTREVGDRAGEIGALIGLAHLYQSMHRYQESYNAFEESIVLAQQVTYPAVEVAGLVGLALLLYQHLDRLQEATARMEQALSVLVATDLPQDAAGHTKENIQQYLDAMHQGINVSMAIPAAQMQRIVANTIAVITVAQDRRDEWRKAIAKLRQEAQQRGSVLQIDVDFFSVVLEILDGKSSNLPANHPYAQAVTAIQEGIAAGGTRTAINLDETMQAVRDFFNAENWKAIRQIIEKQQAVLFQPEVETFIEQYIAQAQARGDQFAVDLLKLYLSILRGCKMQGIAATFEQIETVRRFTNLSFDVELISRSIEALTRGPQEKMQHIQYLTAKASQAGDEGLKALIMTIQLALFSNDLSQLGQDLDDIYRQMWEAIVAGVKKEGE